MRLQIKLWQLKFTDWLPVGDQSCFPLLKGQIAPACTTQMLLLSHVNGNRIIPNSSEKLLHFGKTIEHEVAIILFSSPVYWW